MIFDVPKSARLEIKFVCYGIHYGDVLTWLRLHRGAFITPYPDRQVNNVYFDTQTYAAFVENLSGASARTKVRYRWYGESQGPGSGTLEMKMKRNVFGWKLRYKIERAPYEPGDSWRDIRRSLAEQLPLHGKTWIDANPMPVLINRYCRTYFVTSDEKVRATIDTKQAVWDQRFKSYPNFDNPANLPQTVVVEFKFERKDRDLASELLQGIPIRVSRHSKYINGVRSLTGE